MTTSLLVQTVLRLNNFEQVWEVIQTKLVFSTLIPIPPLFILNESIILKVSDNLTRLNLIFVIYFNLCYSFDCDSMPVLFQYRLKQAYFSLVEWRHSIESNLTVVGTILSNSIPTILLF